MAESKMKIVASRVYKRGYLTKEEVPLVDMTKTFKINLIDEYGQSEGMWSVYLTDKVKKDYDKNVEGLVLPCILINNALCYFPNRSWGIVVNARTTGQGRPVAYATEHIEKVKSFYKEYRRNYG
jgi:hypothetical protein